MRAAVLGLALTACGPVFPAWYGAACDRDEDCPADAVCTAAARLVNACEPACALGCDPGWRCDEHGRACRLPCGPGWPSCPGGTVCHAPNCEPG